MLSRCPRFLTARASAAAIAAVTLSSGLALRVPSANAAEMKGAQEIIQAIQEALAGARSAAALPDAAVQAVEQLRLDLDAFAITQDDLPAAAAASSSMPATAAPWRQPWPSCLVPTPGPSWLNGSRPALHPHLRMPARTRRCTCWLPSSTRIPPPCS